MKLQSSLNKLQELLDFYPSAPQEEVDRMKAMTDKEFLAYYQYVMDEDFDAEKQATTSNTITTT